MVRFSCFVHNKARVRDGLRLRSGSKKYICDRNKDLFIFTIIMTSQLTIKLVLSVQLYDGLGT